MEPYEIKSFLEKYARGLHSEEEHQRFIEWTQSASMAEVEAILEEYRMLMPSGASEIDTRLVSSIESAIDQHEMIRGSDRSSGKIVSWRKFYKPVAAAVFLLIAGSIVYYFLQPHQRSDLANQTPAASKNELFLNIKI